MSDLRQTALALFSAAVDRADPALALRHRLTQVPPAPLPDKGRNLILAVGKAAIPMMREALSHFPDPRAALVVTNPENLCDLPGARVIAGSHPVPD